MNEDKIIQKLIEHDQILEGMESGMATRKDVQALSNTMDQAMVILKRLDQERVFTRN